MTTHRINPIILVTIFLRWLVRQFLGDPGPPPKPSEFEKAALIEKFGFNRYL